MTRFQRRVSSSRALASAASLALLAGLAHAQPTAVVFNGSINTNYLTSGNWNGGVIPGNRVGLFYAPVIGGGLTAELLDGNVQVDAAQLNDSSTLRLAPITTFRIRGSGSGVGTGIVSLDNDSTLELNQVGGGVTDLILEGSGSVTFGSSAGTPGRLLMGPSSGNRVYSASGTNTFVNVAIVEGGGSFGLNQMPIDNRGIIRATAGNTMTVSPGSGGAQNRGTLEARNGGTLTLRNSINNASGFIQALAGSVVDLDACSISSGTLQSFGTGYLVVDAGVPTLTNTLLAQGEIRVTPTNYLRAAGTTTANGTITLSHSGAGTSDIRTVGNATFDGTGQIRANDSGGNRLFSESGTNSITLNVPYRGAGQIGVNQTALVLSSLVDNDTAGTLIVEPRTVGTDNNGTIRQSGSGLTQLRGTIDNQQGRLEVTGSGNFDLDGCTLTGGVLADTGGGVFIVDANAPSLRSFTLESGELRIAPGSLARVSGLIVINGVVTLNHVDPSVGSRILFGFFGDAVFSGSGELRSSASSQNSVSSEFARTLVLNIPFRGAGQIGNGQTTTLVLNSLVDNDTAATLVVHGRAGQGLNGTDNNGIIRQSGPGLLRLRGDIGNQQGRLEVTGVGNFDLDECLLIGGVLADTGPGAFIIDEMQSALRGITLASGELNIGVDSSASFAGTNTINGTINLLGASNCRLIIDTGTTTFAGTGEIRMNEASQYILSVPDIGQLVIAPGLTVRGTGQLGLGGTAITNQGIILADLAGGMQLNTAGTGFINEGEVRVESSGSVTSATGPFTQAAGLIRIDAGRLFNRTSGSIVQTGGTIRADGELQVVSDSFQLQGGTLAGDGLVDSIVTQTGGTIDPGPSLTIEGGLTQNVNSTLRIDLNGTGSNDADALSVIGAAALNGTLRVVIGSNYTITPGNQFVILTTTRPRTGTFTSLVIDPPQLGVTASIQYLSSRVLLTINSCEICGYCNYDYNRDENVDLLDAQQMAQVFVGLLTPEPNWLDGDLNLDENADLNDAQILARAIVQGLCEL